MEKIFSTYGKIEYVEFIASFIGVMSLPFLLRYYYYCYMLYATTMSEEVDLIEPFPLGSSVDFYFERYVGDVGGNVYSQQSYRVEYDSSSQENVSLDRQVSSDDIAKKTISCMEKDTRIR